MAKNILLFSDGTGNSSAKLFKTNVWRLYQSADRTPAAGQIAYYDDGVGTSSFKPLTILGGALGFGLKRNVIEAYIFLSRHYQPDDRIYGFGFSRGAYTIRMVAAFVISQGLANGATESQLRKSAQANWKQFRRDFQNSTKRLVSMVMKSQRPPAKSGGIAIPIRFLGLWDTVDAYGLPIDELTRAWHAVFFPLMPPDQNLSQGVEKACHALAMDDERNTFHPVLWNEATESQQAGAAHTDQERITQVWFAGMHANVGGGYPDDSLSAPPLAWIMEEAEKAGLKLLPWALAQARTSGNPEGKMHNSRSGAGASYRYNPRKIEKLCDDDFNKVRITRPKIHESVFTRIKENISGYSPIVLPAGYAVVDGGGNILDGAANPHESPKLSAWRAAEQERAWDQVWLRRVVYFASVFTAAWIAAFPVHKSDFIDESMTGIGSAVSRLINYLGSYLPSYAAPWISSFKANPYWALGSFAALGLLLWQSGRLQKRINDTMHLIWTAGPGSSPPPAPRPPDSWIYRLRSSNWYQRGFKALTRCLLPFAAGVIAVYFVIAVLAQSAFMAESAMGGICKPSGPAKAIAVDGQQTRTVSGFETKAECWASGLTVTEGSRYAVSLTISQPWFDAGIPAGARGFGPEAMSLVQYPALLFRRKWFDPWFKPFVRIGEKAWRNTRSSLPAKPTSSNTLVSSFTARPRLCSQPGSPENFSFSSMTHLGFTTITRAPP